MSARARQAGRIVHFAGHYLVEFVKANIEVTRKVLGIRMALDPAVLTMTLRCRTDVELASYISLVGLTPGTLVVDSRDGRPTGDPVVVTVHRMHTPDAAQAIADLADLEEQMLRAWRRDGVVPARDTTAEENP